MIARPTDHILCGMASPKSFVSSYPHNYLVILPLNVRTEIFTREYLINYNAKRISYYMKVYFWVMALVMMIGASVQDVLCASTSREEYFYDSRADQPYRSPHNSGSLYSDGGTEDRDASDTHRLQNNFESYARSRSSSSYDIRSGGNWSIDRKSSFRYERRTYGRY